MNDPCYDDPMKILLILTELVRVKKVKKKPAYSTRAPNTKRMQAIIHWPIQVMPVNKGLTFNMSFFC
jgi:hypothetical protein